METPSSIRRITRSQALAASNNSSSNKIPVSRKIEDSEKNMSKSSRQRKGQQEQDRSALVDITNDSPIVGLATGANLETPSSFMAKKLRGSRVKNTPGSGEALLRGQVKILLQQVEEEAELFKNSPESCPFLQLVNSPIGLVAPTQANMPQFADLSGDGSLNNSVTGFASVTGKIVQENLIPDQVVDHMFDGKKEENCECDKSVITRSLFQDFSEKSQVSDLSVSECSSELTYQEVVQGGNCSTEKLSASTEDDNASIWSLQAQNDEEEEIAEEEEGDYYEETEGGGGDEYEDGGLLLDELCEGLNNISVNERGVAINSKFVGKHKICLQQ